MLCPSLSSPWRLFSPAVWAVSYVKTSGTAFARRRNGVACGGRWQTNQAELILRQDSRELRYDVPIEDRSFRFVVGSLYEGNWKLPCTSSTPRATSFIGCSRRPAVERSDDRPQLDLVPAGTARGVHRSFYLHDKDRSAEHDQRIAWRVLSAIREYGWMSSTSREVAENLRLSGKSVRRRAVTRLSARGGRLIRPGKVTTVIWSVSTGDLQVVGEVHPAPGRPGKRALSR